MYDGSSCQKFGQLCIQLLSVCKQIDFCDDDKGGDKNDDDEELFLKENLLCRGSSRGGRRDQRERRGRSQLQTVGSPTDQ